MIPYHMYHFYWAHPHFILLTLTYSVKWRRAVEVGASTNRRHPVELFCTLLIFFAVYELIMTENSQWGMSLVTADGDVWRKHRRIMGPAFNNKLWALFFI